MMNARWIWIAGAVVAVGLVALVAGLLSDAWLQRRRAGLIGFAAGALLAAAMLDILPEALAVHGPQALRWSMISFMAVALAEWWLSAHVHRRGGARGPVHPFTLLGSDALHNIADGIAIAAAFLVSVPLGITTALAVIVHELPEEVGDYVLLRTSGLSKRRALSALATVQGTAALGAAGTVIAAAQTEQMAGVALSIAAGTFLFIAATDLLPEVMRSETGARDRAESALGFLLGAVVVGVQALW